MIISGLETKKVNGLWLENIGNRQTLSHYYVLRSVEYSEDKKVKKFKKILSELFANRIMGAFTIVPSDEDGNTIRICLKEPHPVVLNDQKKQAQLYHLFNYIGLKINHYLLEKKHEKKAPRQIEFEKKVIQEILNTIRFTRP